MTKKQKWILAIILVISFILVILLILISFVNDQSSSILDIFPTNTDSTIVIVIKPDNLSQWPADAFIPIFASTYGEKSIAALELWADGKLIESKIPVSSEGSNFAKSDWKWMPGSVGEHKLMVRAITADEHIIYSNAVRIIAYQPVGFDLLYPISGNETIEEIVENLNIPIQDLVDDNPNLPADGSLSEGEYLHILTDPIIKSDISLSDPISAPADDVKPVSTGFFNNLSLLLKERFSASSGIPLSPDLSVFVDRCTVDLLISDNSNDEFGFFVYRSDPGSSTFQRVSALNANSGVDTLLFSDPDQQGLVQYYVSAFNDSGEGPSNLVQINLADNECKTATTGGLQLNGDTLELPQEVQLAYFYFSINNEQFKRFPEEPQSFLSPDGNKINIKPYLDILVATSPEPIITIAMEVWGWEDGKLIELGTFYSIFDYTDLKICNLGINCTGDVASGFRSSYGEIASDGESQNNEFYWTSNIPGITGVLWQISSVPFLDNFQFQPQGLIASGCSEQDAIGNFIVDFSDLSQYQPAVAGCGMESLPYLHISPNFFWNAASPNFLPTTYYARAIPMLGNLPAGQPSNTVKIKYGPSNPVLEPIIVDKLPDIYDVEIVSFEPIDSIDPAYWGCVYITNLDYGAMWDSFRGSYPQTFSDSFISDITNQYFNELNKAKENGWAVCPIPYQGEDDSILSEWGSMLVEGLGSFWDNVVATFDALKNGIVDATAGILNGLGFPCDQSCKDKLMTGLEIGITYFTGIPPTLPNFDELSEMGIDYAIELAAAEAGIPCPEECKVLLREGLQVVVDAAVKTQSQPGCVGKNWANVLGKEPLCLPPGVETDPVPEGVYHPAVAAVKVTRSGDGPAPEQFSIGDLPVYAVDLQVTVTNGRLIGKTLTYRYNYSVSTPLDLPGSDIIGLDLSTNNSGSIYLNVPIDDEISGQAFKSQIIAIPPLGPGESVTIPISLQPNEYWILEHIIALVTELNTLEITLDDVGGLDGGTGINTDWNCLYKSGLIKVEAQILCLNMNPGLIGTTSIGEDSRLVPCGSEAIPWVEWEISDPCVP